MKKVYSLLMVGAMALAFVGSTFAYTPTPEDEGILAVVEKKVQNIATSNPTKLMTLATRIEFILPRLDEDSRAGYIIGSLYTFIMDALGEDDVDALLASIFGNEGAKLSPVAKRLKKKNRSGNDDDDDSDDDDDDDSDDDDDDDSDDDDDDDSDDDDDDDSDDDDSDDDHIAISDLPTVVTDYVAANYTSPIIKAEMDDEDIDVELEDGTKLEFDLEGNFVEED